jgi:hypothetical protein
VTAKHVLEYSPGQFYDRILIRLNTRNGNSEYIPLDLSKRVILTHKDDNVDLAATLYYLPQDYFDYLYIPQNYFTNSNILAQKNIREGSTAFFCWTICEFLWQTKELPYSKI